MKKYRYLLVGCFLILLSACSSEVAPSTAQGAGNAELASASFISSMGCNDENCTNSAHYHGCKANCMNTVHFHDWQIDCTDKTHHHDGAVVDNDMDNDVTTVSFLSSMGCNNETCEDSTHYHSCKADCANESHYHDCQVGCTDEAHNHNNNSVGVIYVDDGNNLPITSFVSSMGCSGENCINPAHYHDCGIDCTNATHYHDCQPNCTVIDHDHGTHHNNHADHH